MQSGKFPWKISLHVICLQDVVEGADDICHYAMAFMGDPSILVTCAKN